MLCDDCHESDAVVQLTTIKDNVVMQLHLCERCAAQRGVETTVNTMPKHPLGEFLQSVQQQVVAGSRDTGTCPFCGSTMADFRTTGRWGCPRCYSTFEPEIRELLRRVQGSSHHVGRTYQAPQGEAAERAAVLGELRDRLRRAIDNEHFELAADLRDRIRVME